MKDNSTGNPDTRRAAERYMRAGFAVLPIPAGEKNPNRRGWQNERHAVEDIPRLWTNGQNIGVLTGEPSGWLVDVDLDCPEAVEIAGWFLEPTRTSGRESNPDSHWWYRCEGIGSATYEDLGGSERDPEVILEIRSNGRQTVVAPSRHPEGDRYRWSESGLEFAEVGADELLRSCRELASAVLVARVLPTGGRHRFGLALAGFMLRRGLESERVERIMHAAWDAAGYESVRARREAHADIEGIVRDTAEGLAEGSEVSGGRTLEDLCPGLPRRISRYWRWSAERQEPPRASGERGFARTDLGNAERLVVRHGRDLRYVYDWRRWLGWDGRRYRTDQTGEVVRRAKETVRAMYHEADPGNGAPVDTELAKHALRSQSRGATEAMIALAQSELPIPITPDELDADPWLLNVENGTLDLRTGELRVHRREDLLTKIAPVEYEPNAPAPIWEAFLERVLPSEALRRFLKKAIGYSALGVVSEEILVILHGSGDNGKTTLVNAVLEALGDYAIQAARDLLLTKRDAHPTELTDLFGTRFVSCAETDDGRRLAEALVKQITGRERIRARGMRQDFWQFDPTHTVFLATNHRPEVRGTDHAIWRRIKLVPFEVKIPEEEKDKHLQEKLRAELPGILAWIVSGCLDYQREGLGEPEEVERATQGYRAEMDVLAGFIEDRCVEHPDAEAPATPLWEAWKRWCEETGEVAGVQRTFGMRLKERGYRDFKYKGGPHKDRKGWRGIGLRANDPGPGGGGADDRGGSRAHEPLHNAARSP